MGKDDLEKAYFNILKEYFGEKFVNFKKGEKPDFQNEQDSIGIELVSALDCYTGARRAFSNDITCCNTVKEAYELSDKKYNGKFKECVNGELNEKPQFGYIEIIRENIINGNIICDVIEHKLKKLDSYKKFNTNILLITDGETFSDKKFIQNKIVPKIRSFEKKYSNQYDEYFILRLTETRNLYIIKSDNTVKHIIINEEN